MLMDKQNQATAYPDASPINFGDSRDVSTFFFPATFLEPSTSDTFLELDPAGFFPTSSSMSAKGSCFNGTQHSAVPHYSSSEAAFCLGKLEPSREPCTDEIPWPDLVFWLGNTSTGEVVCPCAQCTQRAMHNCNGQMMHNYRYAPYQQQQQQQQQQQRRRVSSRVPVINMPRIEGVN